jgi:beta-1,4-N-acetylglucosaminyltransferase
MLILALIFLFIFPCFRLIKIIFRRGLPVNLAQIRHASQTGSHNRTMGVPEVHVSNNRKNKPEVNVRVCAVLGSGGHTTEMIRIVKCLDDCFTPLCLVQADTDRHSTKMAQENLKEKKYSINLIPRAREVKQSWWTTLLSTSKAIVASIPIIFDYRPDLLLLNGPGTCIPIVIAAILLQLTTNHDVKIVFIESFCRVESLSLTGKLLYHTVADVTLVQWPQLLQSYPRVKYRGKF